MGEWGYCGIRTNRGGRLTERAPSGSALVHAYLDRLPTNCCADWFCRGSHEEGCNLAVFFYGCSFDCFFCQNAEHKQLEKAPCMTVDELVEKALEPSVRCVCFFGGTPEPQLPFALQAAEMIIERSGGSRHICWEWNGTADPGLAARAAALSKNSGGTVKFDLKAFDLNLHLALCGTDNRRTLDNFRVLAEQYAGQELVTAATLLVPYYVDAGEVEQLASYIAEVDSNTPYSLLVFHPDFLMDDLPVTPRAQVNDCYEAACMHLNRVNIGNRQILQD
jgi:pyruvate formate lyase activating enzyme